MPPHVRNVGAHAVETTVTIERLRRNVDHVDRGDDGLTVERIFVSGEVLILKSDSPDQQTHLPRLVFLKGRRIREILVGPVMWIRQEEE